MVFCDVFVEIKFVSIGIQLAPLESINWTVVSRLKPPPFSVTVHCEPDPCEFGLISAKIISSISADRLYGIGEVI